MEDVGAGIGAFDGFDGGSGGSDLVSLWRFPGEKPDRFKSNREDHSVRTSLHTSVAPDSIQLQGGFQASGKLSSSVAKPVVQRDCLKQNFEAFDARAEQTVVPFDCAGKLDPYGENFSPFAATSGPNDFFSLGLETAYGSMFEVCHPDMPWCSMGSSLVYEYESHNLEDAQHKPVMENMEVDLDTVHDFIECLSENSETFRSQVVKSSECPFLNIDHGLNNRGACITGEVDRFETRSACSTSRATLKVQDGSNYIPVLKSQRSEQLFDHLHCGMPSQEIACLKDEQVGEGGKSSNLNEAGDRENFVRDAADHNACSPASVIGGSLGVKSLEQRCPSSEVVTSGEMEPQCVKDETGNGEPILFMDTLRESSHVNSKDCRNCSHIDGVPDICIIEDASQPAPSHQSPSSKTEAGNLQQLKWHHHRAGNMNLRPKNERLYRRVASQDFSQPKSETTPPEGVLAVPLLRHQRIALSWMISQETANLYCSGGILADDQGLGKTVSTIALILKERPPSVRACAEDVRKVASETLNLDDDDDNGNDDNKGDGDQWSKGNQESDEKQVNECSIQRPCPLGQAKGRPAAGTLIVCPTSLLRQWADELGNKVTSKANLSVLVYHGKSRTKDPDELAKYNVVLTTYAIVSMEFPKQPSADGDGDEKERSEGDDTPQMGVLSGKKRKSLPCSDKRGAKHRKGVDSLLLESVCGPLAKVAWFRVVLDEAQSIKNHRTQVARACWGLRAKRRWCLSGTPIQNAVDDLYSYFRFLRCDRYATYKEFCARIKNEISRNPSKGYMRLRAILKLIMLRRTKGTFLDGKPIISLPPKVVELKKVEFSKEEREFYTRLESETSAQFKEYAAAGTVKQNYVNILLMLLRLRQACDHPALVNGSESNPLFSSSVLTAKKIPRKKQIRLLRCLKASLALCRICSDPPEDAVVSICGHVFCNQCISEHLMGDDKQCPAVNCKVQLSLSSVFSKATLEGSVSDNQVRDSYPEDSVSVDSEPVGPCSATKSYDSAKIRAALQVLRSLSQPQDHTSINGGENSSGFQTGGYNGSPGKQRMETCETLKGSGKVIGGKAIVFSQWTRMLDLFEAGLKNCSILYRRLDGTMSVAARDRAVKDFNTLPEVSVIIMSLKAASLGLNLVTASHVLLLDLWWNPTTEDQAIDRAHRIGQTRPVTVLRLTVKDTIEDRILALQKKKRKMVASAFGEDGRGNGSRQSSRFTVEDLQFLFSG